MNRFRTPNVPSRTRCEIVSKACKWFEVGTPHDAFGSLSSQQLPWSCCLLRTHSATVAEREDGNERLFVSS